MILLSVEQLRNSLEFSNALESDNTSKIFFSFLFSKTFFHVRRCGTSASSIYLYTKINFTKKSKQELNY